MSFYIHGGLPPARDIDHKILLKTGQSLLLYEEVKSIEAIGRRDAGWYHMPQFSQE